MTLKRRYILALCLVLPACARRDRPALEDLTTGQSLSAYKIESTRGVRDGDRLAAQVLISDSSSILTLDLHFAVGSPTTLESGTWRWAQSGRLLKGAVMARSVTFLGGQDDGPSIGGVFDLTGDDQQLRVTLPLTVLPRHFSQAK